MKNISEAIVACTAAITLGDNSSASGFQLNCNDYTYFITAKHVLFDNNNNLKSDSCKIICQTEDININAIFEVNLEMLNNNSNVFYHPTKDVAAFKLFSVTQTKEGLISSHIPGINIIQSIGNKSFSIQKNSILFINDISISNDIFLYGYPSSLGLKESPQFDYQKPLLRKGVVASINKNQGTIILDCPVYYGNSGGPVLYISDTQTRNYNIIGVASQFIPYVENWINISNNIIHSEMSNSGYSVAVAMDYVYEMLSIKI